MTGQLLNVPPDLTFQITLKIQGMVGKPYVFTAYTCYD
jgi:hypothetical protein